VGEGWARKADKLVVRVPLSSPQPSLYTRNSEGEYPNVEQYSNSKTTHTHTHTHTYGPIFI
jgi:hypothetical protein